MKLIFLDILRSLPLLCGLSSGSSAVSGKDSGVFGLELELLGDFPEIVDGEAKWSLGEADLGMLKPTTKNKSCK